MTPLCQETVGTFIETRGRNIPLHERVCIQTFDEAKRIARVQVAGGQSYIDINVDEAVGTDGVAYGDDAELFKVITEYVRSQSPPEPDLAPTPTRAPWSPPGASPTPWTGSRTEIGKAYPFTLYVHCGVREASFDERRWIATPILTDSWGGPPPGWSRFSEQGTMMMITENLLRFTSSTGQTADFRPLGLEEEYPWGPCA